MKIIKGFFFFVLILLAAGLLAALFAPGSKNIERSITINAPASKIFNQVANFKNWTKWDPWYSRDTNQIRNYEGTLGDEEYGYSWKSDNKEVGEGRMKMSSVEENKKCNYEFFFQNGNSEEKAEGSFEFEERDGKTKVTWTMLSEMTYPMKIMNYFMDGWIGPDFEKGLANLKSYVESAKDQELSPASDGVQIITEQGINYAVIRSNDLPMSDLDNFFSNSYTQLYGYIQTNGLSPKGPSRALFYDWDEENGKTSLAAAVPISDLLLEEGTDTDIGIGTAKVKSNSIEYVQMGSYTAGQESHNALGDWLESNGKTLVLPVVEEYVKGPNETADSSQYVTKIIYYF